MLAFQPKDTKRLIAAALGNVENDLAIEGCRIFNVFTKEFLEATVYICDGFISHVEYNKKNSALPSKQRLQLNGILCPGFIDAHTHIESSLYRNIMLLWFCRTGQRLYWRMPMK